jgi:hypothetical protein
MNTCIKVLIDKAIHYPKEKEARDAALDVIYAKLIVIPLQKAWRNKSDEDKKMISKFILNQNYRLCWECDTPFLSQSCRTACVDCYYEEKYRGNYDD